VRVFGVAASPGRHYGHFMRRIDDAVSSFRKEEIETRLKIVRFFDDYGARATRRAYGKSRSTIYLWNQKLKPGGTAGLAPGHRSAVPTPPQDRVTVR
jgi:putative transposase